MALYPKSRNHRCRITSSKRWRCLHFQTMEPRQRRRELWWKQWLQHRCFLPNHLPLLLCRREVVQSTRYGGNELLQTRSTKLRWSHGHPRCREQVICIMLQMDLVVHECHWSLLPFLSYHCSLRLDSVSWRSLVRSCCFCSWCVCSYLGINAPFLDYGCLLVGLQTTLWYSFACWSWCWCSNFDPWRW